MSRPLERRRLCFAVQAAARRCGQLDAAGQLDDLTRQALRDAQAAATGAACGDDDIAEATLDGLDEGRREPKLEPPSPPIEMGPEPEEPQCAGKP